MRKFILKFSFVIHRNTLLTGINKNPDFPYGNTPMRTKVGHPPPPSTVIGEYYAVANSKFTEVQKLSARDWFFVDSDVMLVYMSNVSTSTLTD